MKRISTLALAATLFLQSAAFAGAVAKDVVTITNGSAGGSFLPTRNSTDTGSYIGCKLNTYDNKEPNITCAARDRYGKTLSCYADSATIGATDFPRMMAAVAGISSYGSVAFAVGSSGYCSWVGVGHYSDQIP